MGEKIRDIKSIKIGKSSFMVELNEGYSASQGRLIHIQNKKFRYLLTEKDFFHLSAMVMRSWSEFSYLKHKLPIINKITEIDESTRNTSEVVDKIVHAFSRNRVDYRLLDTKRYMISIVVQDKDLLQAENAFADVGARKKAHPMGKESGYQFLYQMHPFLMYEIEGYNIEIFCQLPCRSITAKTWIPLDRMIQRRMWSVKKHVKDAYWCDDSCRYIFLLCWAIFVDQGFSPHIVTALKSSTALLNEDGVEELFSTVFFSYSSSIIKKLKNNDFENIIPEYYGFINY